MKRTLILNKNIAHQIAEQRGFTIIELMVTLVILAILASVTMPLLKLTLQRNKESNLKQHLMQLRVAIDDYKQAVDAGFIAKEIDQSGYPPNLEILVNGVENIRDPKKRKIKFLRSIPNDPMRNLEDTRPFKHDWGLRSYNTDVDNPKYDGDVFDVYSLSPLKSIRGEPYAQW
jgi:general secretion pathway protein G